MFLLKITILCIFYRVSALQLSQNCKLILNPSVDPANMRDYLHNYVPIHNIFAMIANNVLQDGYYPPETIKLMSTIQLYIKYRLISIDGTLEQILQRNYQNCFDLLLATLMQIYETTPLKNRCLFRNIGKTISYLLKQKYGNVQNCGLEDFRTCNCCDNAKLLQSPTIIFVYPTVETVENQTIATSIPEQTQENVSIKLNAFRIIDFIPKPISVFEQNHYNNLITYFEMNHQEVEVDNISDVKIILKQLLGDNTIIIETRYGITYYLVKIIRDETGIDFVEIFLIIPKPENNKEFEMFEVFVSYMLNHEEMHIYESYTQNRSSPLDMYYLLLENMAVTHQETYEIVSNYYLEKTTILLYGFNFFNLLKLIDDGTLDENEQQQLEIIRHYFYQSEFRNLWLDAGFNITSITLLNEVIQIIIKGTTNMQVKEACSYFLTKIKFKEFIAIITQILTLIPAPTNELETKYLDSLKAFLYAPSTFKLFENYDLNLYENDLVLLGIILKHLNDNITDETMKEIIQYYMLLIDTKVVDIQFVGEKVLTRQFPITEIFTDSLDTLSFNLEQKNSFRKLLNYLASDSKDIIANFEQWDQAKTRAEFTETILTHLLNSDETPDEIKTYINVLRPYIRTTGNAALAP